jgi:hypothetical protein
MSAFGNKADIRLTRRADVPARLFDYVVCG